MQTLDTIVAPATPPGEGGVSIVRLSGPQSLLFLSRFFRPACGAAEFSSHQLYYGHLLHSDGRLLDEVMAVYMAAPRTYTREDVVEIHCHGSPAVVRDVLDLSLASGVRLARPGEFTLRAFLNGRLDLAQAEAVIDLIHARTQSSQRAALAQMEGRLSQFVYSLRERLCEQLALVETYVDFPDEDIEHPHMDALRSSVAHISQEIEHVLANFDFGRILREGLSLIILGRPNVGKSSLMNQLLGEQRAIVTDIAGTTRDTIEEHLSLGGIPVRLIDTAGIRETTDPIEAEGVRRACSRVESADLVVLVVDGSVGITAEDCLALTAVGQTPLMLAVNKSDLDQTPLDPPFCQLPQVPISARSGEGVAELCEGIVSLFSASDSLGGEDPLLSDRRHRESLLQCDAALKRFSRGLEEGLSPEFLALELREGLDCLGQITGETTPDEILNRIFDGFCIGK